MATKSKFELRLYTGSGQAFLLEAISDLESANVTTPLAFGSIIFLSGFVFQSPEVDGVSYHLLDFSVLVAAVLFHFALSLFVPKLNISQAAKNLSSWIFIGIVSACVPPLAVFAITGHVSEMLVSLIPLGLVAYPFVVFALGVVIGGWRLSRSNLRRLKLKQAELTRTQSQLENQITVMRTEIRENVEQELRKTMDVLADESLSPKEISKSLLFSIDTVIRPLSHRLAGLGEAGEHPPTQITMLPKPAGSLSDVELSRLAAPDIFALPAIINVLPTAFLVSGLPGLSFASLQVLALLLSLWVIENLFKNFRVNRIAGIVALTFLSLLVGLPFSSLFKTQDAFGVSMGFVISMSMTSGLMALISRRIDVLNRLAYVNQEIEQSVSLLRQEVWVLKTELAKAIHGSVQAKFLSLSLQFDSLKSVSKKQLAAAAKEVKKVIDSVDDSFKAAAMTFDQQMELIFAAWDKSVRIDLSLTNEIRDKIDTHPIARTCLVEVIGEAVANAAKHNSSPRVSVEISSSEGRSVQVLVTSEGRLTRVDNSRKGYGSKMLNEVTSAWSLTSAKGRVYLHAVVPLAK